MFKNNIVFDYKNGKKQS